MSRPVRSPVHMHSCSADSSHNPQEVAHASVGDADSEEQIIHDFEHAARSAPSLQLQLLSSILSSNASCHYLLDHGLNHRSDPHSFKSCIPVVESKHVQPLLQRIADGDTSPILCCQPITGILFSSGTSSGISYMVPFTKESTRVGAEVFAIKSALMKREFPTNPESKSLSFVYAGKLQTTRGGLKAGALTSHTIRGEIWSRHAERFTSPMAVFLGSDIRQSMYCHLLCGLLQASNVSVLHAFFAFAISEAFRMLETVWNELCVDIRLGTLSKRITDEAIRAEVSKILHSDPQLADRIQVECARNCWTGIVRRLWPNVKYVHSIMTGAMAPYVPYIRSYAGDVPLICDDYVSSECFIGLNLNLKSPPEQVSFTLIPSAAYFEFLPLNEKTEEAGTAEPVDITAVQIGKEYEMVVTTTAGLYRHRLGDIVRVTGFYHALPQVAYIRRRSVLLSINTDKTDENELYLVISKACKILKDEGVGLRNYTSYADHSSRPGYYAIFWELSNHNTLRDSTLQRCCEIMDSSFNDWYMGGRAAGTIGALRLHIVEESTFFNIMEFSVKSGASMGQYKTPRSVKTPGLVNILKDSTVRLFCSTLHSVSTPDDR